MWQFYLKSGADFFTKAVAAALFGILLLIAFALTAPMANQAFYGFFRYDYLLLFCLIVQGCLLYYKLETWEEAKVIALFHFLAFLMELFLTHPAIGSWQYPQPAVFKIYTVPLFAGFMYSAVGSFFARSLRLYQVKIENLPKFSYLFIFSILAYLNFMTKFFIPDIRVGLFIWSVILFYRSKIYFQVYRKTYCLPMLPILLLLALIIWIAENVSTFYQIWLYPSQVQQWHMVSWGKFGSWYLLLMFSLVLVLYILGKRQADGLWQLNEKHRIN